VVVRLAAADGWQTFEAPAGAVTMLPVVVGRDGDRAIPVELPVDPAALVEL
jgi:hypothetical protein